MDRSEPSLVPEWYRGTGSSSIAGSNFNLHTCSSHSATDELNSQFSSRNRLSITICDHDAPRSLSFTDGIRTSSCFHVSSRSNGFMGRENDLPSRAYISSGRSHHDRNCDREKDLVDEFSTYTESLIGTKSEKVSSRRSHSMASRSLGDPWIKRSGHDSSNGIPSRGSITTGISKSSFERDFPSLGAEEKNVGSDVARVVSPGLSAAIHNLPLTASIIVGGDGWTSALAEVPRIVLSVPPSSPAMGNASTGLNMAETLVQAPARVCTTPQLPNDSQKIEELQRLQILKLRPVTPTMPKNLGLNPVEKSKTKETRMAEFITSKTGQQSSHLVIHAARRAGTSDVSKTSKPGNFQVLNWERNSLSPTSKGGLNPTNVARVPAAPSGVSLPPKGSLNLEIKVDGKGGALSPSSYVEKKLPSQAKNRNEFFNSLRKKASCTNDEPTSEVPFNSEKAEEQFAIDSAPKKNDAENGNCSSDAFEEPAKLDPDEEEASFLRSLGWEEDAGEEALTREEIESFLSVYKSRRTAPKLDI